MVRILAFLTLIASAIYPSYVLAEETLPAIEFQDMKRAGQETVQDVLSPLTLLMEDGSIIRLSGIDVPDAYSDEPSVLAVTARDILKDLLNGQRIEIYQTRDREVGRVNRMGHRLAQVKLVKGEVWAQGVLLKLGLARVKTNSANAHMAEEMLALEALAREEQIGIWQDGVYPVYDEDDAALAIGDFAIIEGRVESVALKKNRLYVNFGKDWRNDFTISIAPSDKRTFSKAGIDPQQWGGRIIRARGSVREYNGPYMEVTHPAAVEFIEE